MNGSAIDPTSPISPRISKAAFFRARSPPIEPRSTNGTPTGPPNFLFTNSRGQTPDHELANSFDLQTRLRDHVPSSAPSSETYRTTDDQDRGQASPPASQPMASSSRPRPLYTSAGSSRRPLLDHSSSSAEYSRISGRSADVSTPTSPRALLAGLQGAMAAPNSSVSEGTSYETDPSTYEGSAGLKEGAVLGLADGSDEMLMTLLAGQAAVDCETLPIGGWEQVESWKKELSLLSNRLSSLVARHQRELKILTAARTLQKLNNQNKRLSKQTMESLEQSEKRAEAAEKEVLVLREREAALRRQLMEHWAGVMAWEVRRLERVSAEAQARFNRQIMRITVDKERENQLSSEVENLEAELQKKDGRVEELEEMVVEMGRRERAIEEDIRELDEAKKGLERDKQGWLQERHGLHRDREGRSEDQKAWERERHAWTVERRQLTDELEGSRLDKQRVLETGRMSDHDRAVMERVRGGLGGILGHKSGAVGEAEVVDAVEEVKHLLKRRENEVVSLKEEMREVNMGLEEEVRRVSEDRDLWKTKVERSEALHREEKGQLDRKIRSHTEQISDLSMRNESLSTSLAAAQTHVSSLSSSSDQTKALQTQVDGLAAELESIAGQFNAVWSILPHPSRRAEAELVDPRTGLSNSALTSPSRQVNFAALQNVYRPNEEKFSGIDEMLNRVRGVVDDGRLLVERVVRMGQERELLKNNATKAKKLVEDSRHSLETYQRQVAVLEDRLATSGDSDSRFLEELNSLRQSLDTAQSRARQLDSNSTSQQESLHRLNEANNTLSQRALTLADEAEQEKRILQKRLNEEVDELKRRLGEAEEDADEQRTRGQAQRIQLLDELNSLQAEVGDLRKQLRQSKGGTPGR